MSIDIRMGKRDNGNFQYQLQTIMISNEMMNRLEKKMLESIRRDNTGWGLL